MNTAKERLLKKQKPFLLHPLVTAFNVMLLVVITVMAFQTSDTNAKVPDAKYQEQVIPQVLDARIYDLPKP
ncbi:MAG: hypothetical protein ACPGXL_02455 [Chitinophagales bacterium]